MMDWRLFFDIVAGGLVGLVVAILIIALAVR